MTTTTTTPIPTTSHETHDAANAIEKTAAGTATPVKASITTTPAVKIASSVTETVTYKSALPNATDYCGTKTPTKARKGTIPITIAAPTTPVTTALNEAHPHLPLKPGSYVSNPRTKIGRWRTC